MLTEQPGVERLASLISILDLARATGVTTRLELTRSSGLSRRIVAQRVSALVDAGLLVEGALGASTGGRMPRELRFRGDAGHVLAAHLGATGLSAAVSDVSGRLLASRSEPNDITAGPERALARVEQLFDGLLEQTDGGPGDLWGVGIGLPGPIEFATGRPVSPPIMPGWDRYPVRERFVDRYDVATWVDNDVNLMALGEMRAGCAVAEKDMVFLKIGTGIGAGLVSGGRLHRGAQGVAGDIGHVATVAESSIVCRCGNTGCLEALAGGAALARDGTAAARSGASDSLARRLAASGELTAQDVADAAVHGDPVGVELLSSTGRYVGQALATLINCFNPSLVVLGGRVTESGEHLLPALRSAVYARSLPLATRDLRITTSQLGAAGGLIGAAFMVVDELLSEALLPRWLDAGSPAGQPQLALPRATA